jgi:serine/threonine protein kinase
MTDDIQKLFDQFATGGTDFAGLQQGLSQLEQSDPSCSATIIDAIESMYKSGRLPPQLYNALLAQLGMQQQEPGRDQPSEDATIIPSGARVEAGDDTTVIPDSTGTMANVDATNIPDRTRIKAVDDATNIPDRTRLKTFETPRPAGPAPNPVPATNVPSDFQAVDATRHRPTAPTVTGSNWANPEQWSESQSGPIEVGSVIKNRYYLESELGRGGMGVVFKARDRRKEEANDPDPYVAIKVLGEDFQQHPQSFVALQREWKKVQSLSHENIITVHDFDRDGSTVFMTMQLLDGMPLNELLHEHSALGGLPKERAASILDGCARALAFAHEKGIVHADFKPGNIFVNDDNEVKVLDFGIARAVPTALKPKTDDPFFNAEDLGAYTATYASAEMLNDLAPTPADDVYALGIVAYELFTGRHPYDRTAADTARRRSMQPPPLVGPTRRQRRTIRRSVAFDAATRQRDAGVFYRQWRGLELPRWVYAAIAASLLAAAFFGYQALQGPGPDRPFNELSAQEQVAFRQAMQEGEELLSAIRNDGMTAFHDDAFELFAGAYDIHPRNPDAEARLEETADSWLSTVNGLAPAERRTTLEGQLQANVPGQV